MAREFTDGTFKESVLDTNQVVLVDFWATWCGPCVKMSPIIEQLSEEFAGRALVGKVDVDANPEVAMQYNIRSIPTLLIIKNGEVVDRQVGGTSLAVLKQKIEKYL